MVVSQAGLVDVSVVVSQAGLVDVSVVVSQQFFML